MDGFDWSKVIPAFVWAAIGAALWFLLRGQIARLIILTLVADAPRTLDLVMDVLDTKTGRTRVRAMLDDLYADRIRKNDEAFQLASVNRDTLEQVRETQKLLSISVRDMERQMGELPRMTEALERVANATSRISEEMQAVNVSMARIDEREKERERRWHDINPNPQKRSGDHT